MTYQPFLISNFITGFDRELQPWLLPVDAQQVLFDGFMYRGVWQKRSGYSQYATGNRGGSTYSESRMVHQIAGAALTGTIDGTNKTFTLTATAPVRRGTFVVTGSNPAQTLTDDSMGGFTGNGTGTINYTTGAVSVTFTAAPIAASTVLATYDVHQGLPVMGVMNFYTDTNTKELIVADTTYVNRYNPTTNLLEDISPTTLLTGTSHNFFTWANYDSPDSDPRLLFVNNKDPIQRYDGTTVTPYPVFLGTGTNVSGATFNTGNGGATYEWLTPVPILPGQVKITAGAQTVQDNGFGGFLNGVVGTIDYLTGDISVTFPLVVAPATAITIDYTPMTDPIDTCLHLFQFKDRLVLLFPTIISKRLGKRILISGTGIYGDTFVQSALGLSGVDVYVPGSGSIDLSDDSFINSSDFNRDDLLIFTENSTWIMKFSGNDAVPFDMSKIDNSRGTLAPYGTISYLNVTTGESPRGFIGCDGYSVERTDDKIPRFSYDDIDLDNFDLCNAGTVDEDRDHYLIYPTPGAGGISDQILITNYEEFNYSLYRIPLSCMGNFYNTQDITWDDLLRFDSWDEMAQEYSNWNSFNYQSSTPIGIGGGHHGQITVLNESESEDYPVRIRNITGTSMLLNLTTDFQEWQVGDIIYLTGTQGSVEVNNKQGQIVQVISSYNFVLQLDVIKPFTPSAYTANTGMAAKVIQFQSVTKKFNPFAQNDKKVRCGWCYFYVTTTGTSLTDQDGNPVDAILQIRVSVNDTDLATTLTVPNSNYYEVNLTSQEFGNGVKKWYKIWINQTARFIQFDLQNVQAGVNLQIHALMPGFAPTGRLL